MSAKVVESDGSWGVEWPCGQRSTMPDRETAYRCAASAHLLAVVKTVYERMDRGSLRDPDGFAHNCLALSARHAAQFAGGSDQSAKLFADLS